jgi:small subunit ribosomal protein S2
MTSTLVRQLLDAGVHFGHQTKRWNPKMKPFIFGSRSGIYIIDLEKTERQLQAACAFLEEAAAKGEPILYIGTKKQARGLLEAEAQRAGMPYVVTRWLGGTLTNFRTIKRNIDRLLELRKQRAEGYFERISKKDAKRLSRQLDTLEENFSGLASLERLPGCVFVVDTKREQIAVREANRLNLPVVAICDTNSDPDLVQWPIPGNDDAIRSVKLLVSLVTESIIAGRQRFLTQQPVAPQAAGPGAATNGAQAESTADAEGDAGSSTT